MQFFNKDDVLNAFHYRVSTRSYDGDKKIPAEDFNYILELGRLSPSSVWVLSLGNFWCYKMPIYAKS